MLRTDDSSRAAAAMAGRDHAKDRWRPFGLSLAVHALLIAVVVSAWLFVRREPPPPTPLAIEAVVVDSRALGGAVARAPTPPAARPRERAPEPAPPPTVLRADPPTEDAQRAEREAVARALADKVAAERAAAQRRAAEQVAAEKALAEKAAAQKQAAEKAAAEKAAAEKAAADRAAAAKVAAEKAAAEEAAAEKAAAQKAAAEKAAAERAAAEKAAAERAAREAAEARERRAREAELRAQLELEERAEAARASGLGAQWAAAIQAKIQRAWIRPPSARAGLDCTVALTQVPGGEVVSVRVLSCNGDAVTRESIEAAVYRASPLPSPPDPILFERNIEVRFRPND